MSQSLFTFKVQTDRFNQRLQALAKVAQVRRSDFLRNEARLLAEELAKQFTPKQRKAERGIEIERRMAYRTRRMASNVNIPWRRVQAIMRGQRPSGSRPVVRAVAAQVSLQKAKDRLGILAAGFIGRNNRLHATAKPHVMRHVGRCYGRVELHLGGWLRNFIRITNFTPWIGGMRGTRFLVSRALKKRTSAMRTQARLIEQGIKQYMAQH